MPPSKSTNERLDLPDLPWPPTVNTYWRRVGSKTILSAKARAYRDNVVSACKGRFRSPLDGDLAVYVVFRPPDRRRRDIDNLPKGLFDALKYAGVYEDDSQIWRMDVRFGLLLPGGLSSVTVIQEPRPRD